MTEGMIIFLDFLKFTDEEFKEQAKVLKKETIKKSNAKREALREAENVRKNSYGNERNINDVDMEIEQYQFTSYVNEIV